MTLMMWLRKLSSQPIIHWQASATKPAQKRGCLPLPLMPVVGRLRKRKIRQVLASTLHSLHLLKNPPFSPEQTVIQNEIDETIWKAVDGLDEKHRLPVILRYVHELTVPEIAQLLHLSQGTVHSRLHYARKELHAQLEHLNPHEKVSDETS